MNPEIRSTPLVTTLLGLSTRHDPAKCYGEEIMALMGRFWPVLKDRGIANPGINWVVYDAGGEIFAGVETVVPDPKAIGLETRTVRLARYAEARHVGPYSKLHETCTALTEAVEKMGLLPTQPLIEVYGHWTPDESRLETNILLAVA